MEVEGLTEEKWARNNSYDLSQFEHRCCMIWTCVWIAKSTKALFRFDSIPGPGHYNSSRSARVVRRNAALFFSSLFLPAVDPLSKCLLYCHEYRPFFLFFSFYEFD